MIVPNHWRIERLGDIADTALGKMLDRGKSRGYPQVAYLRNVNVQWGRIDTDDLLTMELPDHERDRFGVRPGDLLVCEGGEVGRAAIWRGRAEYLAYQKALHRIRSRGEVEPAYLRYLLEHYSLAGILGRHSTGSTILHLPQQNLRQLPVPLPSLGEQRRIVEILEDHISRLDAADRDIGVAVGRMRMLQRANWRECFQTRASGLEPTTLLSVADIANGQTPKGLAERLHTEAVPGTVPFYKVGDMNSSVGREMAGARYFVSRVDARSLGLHIRHAGTVLIPKRGGAIATNKKRLLVAEAAYDLNIMGLQPRGGLDPQFLWHWLDGVDLARLADGSNVPQINAPQIERLSLTVPALDVQAVIVAKLDKVHEKIQQLSQACESSRTRSGMLRRALLAAAFSGRLACARDVPEVVEEMAGV